MTHSHCNLSIVIPSVNEADDLAALIPQVCSTLDSLAITYEIIIVDKQADENTRQVIRQNQCKLLSPPANGYGAAIAAGIQQATGDYIIFMDADQAHPAAFLCDLWILRDTADMVIASRYISNGQAIMPRPEDIQ